MYQTSDEYKELVYQDNTRHLLKIYIEGQEVNPNHIFDFKVSHTLFSNDEFTLGSVTAKTIEFRIYKDSLPETYNNFYVETGIGDEIVPIGHFILESIGKEDDDTITITAIDYMVKFEFNYDGSTLTFPATMLQVLQDICSKAGVECGSTSFLNDDKQIAVYDNTVSAREYLSYIAEQAGGFAYIGRDGKLYIRTIGQNTSEVNIEYFQDFTWGEQFRVSRVAYEDGVQDFKVTGEAVSIDFIDSQSVEIIDELPLYRFSDNIYNTIWINSDNMYIVDKEQIENIYNYYQNFNCYSFEGTTIIDPALDVGDIVLIDNKKVIYQGDMEYVGKFKASISSKIQAQSKEETMITKISDKTKIRRVQSSIDQINGTINLLAEEVDDSVEQVSNMLVQIGEIASSVSEKADLTNTVLGITAITVDDAITGALLKLRIIGNNQVFKPTYLSDELYLSDDTILGGDSLIEVNGVQYDLGIEEELRQLGGVYDEYVYDYLEKTSRVIRRIGVDAESGETYELETEQIEELELYDLQFVKGENIVKILNYTANLEITYAQKNVYTDLLATKAELKSEVSLTATEITQNVTKIIEDETGILEEEIGQLKVTSSEISAEVSKKIGEDDFTKASIVAKINDNTSEVKIEADNVNLNGYVTVTDLSGSGTTTIDGSNIKTGTISADRIDGQNLVIGDNVNLISGKSPEWLSGNVPSPSGLSSNPIVFFGAFNTSAMNTPRNSVGAEIWDNGDVYMRRIYTESGTDSAGYMGFIKTPLSTDSTSINYIVAGTSKINVNTYNGQSFDIYAEVSDEQLKENIAQSNIDALDIIKQISHISFNWKESGNYQALGFSAQQLKTVSEDFVSSVKQPENSEYDEILQVRNFNIMPYMTKAIQELSQQIDELRGENKIYKIIIEDLATRIEKLENKEENT